MGYYSEVVIRCDAKLWFEVFDDWCAKYLNKGYYSVNQLKDGSFRIGIDDIKWYMGSHHVNDYESAMEMANEKGLKLCMYRIGEEMGDYEIESSDEAYDWMDSVNAYVSVEEGWD